MARILVVDAGRIEPVEAAAMPLYLAPRIPEGVDAVVGLARFSDGGHVVGALGLAGRGSVRRHSGGPPYSVEPGDYYMVVVERWGSPRDLYDRVRALAGGGVAVAPGKTAARPYAELYSRHGLEGLVESLHPGVVVEEAFLDTDLLASHVERLGDPRWLDPYECDGVEVSYVVERGGLRFGLRGCVGEGLVLGTWPDSDIYAYPPGLARSIVRELSMIPPSPAAAVHAVNTWLGMVEYWGVEAEDLLEAFRGYMERALEVAGE